MGCKGRKYLHNRKVQGEQRGWGRGGGGADVQVVASDPECLAKVTGEDGYAP